MSGSWLGPEGQGEKESGQVKAEQVQVFLGDWLKKTCMEGCELGRYQLRLSYSLGNELHCSFSRWARLSPAKQENSPWQTLLCVGLGWLNRGPAFQTCFSLLFNSGG